MRVEFKPPREVMLLVDIAPPGSIGRLAREMTVREARELREALDAQIAVAEAKLKVMRAPA